MCMTMECPLMCHLLQDSQCVETEERLAEIRADLVQLQQQYTTCYAQVLEP